MRTFNRNQPTKRTAMREIEYLKSELTKDLPIDRILYLKASLNDWEAYLSKLN
jgi:hypothetical protein